MITISLCMIVRDEEMTLGRCLESIRDIVDEIIIVDTGSTDNTKKVAEKYTKKVYDFVWVDDFAVARNFAFSKGNMDYLMWLDADDVLMARDQEKLKELKEIMNPEIDVVMMKYNIRTDEEGNHGITFTRERLLKRSKNFTWTNPVHEYIQFGGKIYNSDICITHRKIRSSGDRNLKIFEKLVSDGKELTGRNLFYYARELFFNQRYDEAIVYYDKFLNTGNSVISNVLDACIDLHKCYLEKKDNKNALRALIRSFEFDKPHAEICCKLGYYYKNLEDYPKAIFWFEEATRLEKPRTWGSITHDCYEYIPNMELCACYYKSGNIFKAKEYNDKAGEYKPDDAIYLHNKKLFNSVLAELKKRLEAKLQSKGQQNIQA